MKQIGIVALLVTLLFSAGFPAGAQERQMIATLEIRPEYAMPIREIEGFDLSGITVVATHPEITQVSISSSRGVDASFLESLETGQQERLFRESILGGDSILISFY
ncbi:MAG: hypothetical protein HY422_01345 [Candidatus Komeilibacteria bacterium]|nr:hypothetical protein [Candidatus Komeilibacteria bacterium]